MTRRAFACRSLSILAAALTAAVGGGTRVAAAADCDLSDVVLGALPAHRVVTLDDRALEESPEAAELRLSEEYGGPFVGRVFVDSKRPVATTILMLDAGSVASAAKEHSRIHVGFLNGLAGWTDVTWEPMVGPVPGAVALTAVGTDEAGTTRGFYAVSGAVGRLAFAIQIVGDVEALADDSREVGRMFALYREQAARVTSGCLSDAPQRGIGDELGEMAGATVGASLVVGGAFTLVTGLRDPLVRRRWRARLTPPSRHRSERGPTWAGWNVRDVTPFARRRRRRARWGTVLRLFALAGVAMGVAAALLGSVGLLLVAPAGLLLSWLLGRVVARVGDVGPEPRRRTLRPRGAAAAGLWATAIISAALTVVGLACAISWIRWTTLTDYEQAVAAARAGFASADEYGGAVTFIAVIGLAALVAAGALWQLARRLTAPGLHAVRAADERSPVLYLRGFADDGMRIRVTAAGRRGWLARLSLRRRERFEELVAWILSAYGPVVAVADPHSRRRRLGAARESIQVPDWLSVVRDRMHEASTIVVAVGGTEGLAAEVSTLRDEGLLDRCLFLLPPLAGQPVAARWDVVAAALDTPARLDHDDVGSTIITLAGTQAVQYRSSVRDDVGYQASLDLAMADRTRWSPRRSTVQTVA